MGVNLYDDERLKLGQAFGLLQDNIDVIEWLACHMPKNSACVVNRVRNGDVTIRGGECNPTAAMCWVNWPPGNRVLKVNRNSPNGAWDPTYRYPPFGFDGEWHEEDSFCQIAYIASALLHEIVHMCWAWPDQPAGGDIPGEQVCDCEWPYMLMNAFLWAIAQRYSCNWDPTACSLFRWKTNNAVNAMRAEQGLPPHPNPNWVDDRIWMNDGYFGINAAGVPNCGP